MRRPRLTQRVRVIAPPTLYPLLQGCTGTVVGFGEGPRATRGVWVRIDKVPEAYRAQFARSKHRDAIYLYREELDGIAAVMGAPRR